jgi:hypothetical protein
MPAPALSFFTAEMFWPVSVDDEIWLNFVFGGLSYFDAIKSTLIIRRSLVLWCHWNPGYQPACAIHYWERLSAYVGSPDFVLVRVEFD